MKILRKCVVLGMLAACSVLSASAQTAASLSSSDRKAIDETLNTIGDSLTKMDFDTFGKQFTDDADFVNVVGMHWVGKTQIVKAHRIVFTQRYHGYPQHILDESVALIAPDIALVVMTMKMDDYTAQDGKRMENNLSRLTWVLEKQNGRWLVRSGHNTTIDLQAAPHDPGK